MEKISIKETKKILNDTWPGIERVPTDRDFYVPELDWLMDQLRQLHPEMPKHKPNKFACEESAFGSWFLLHRHRTLLSEQEVIEDADLNIHYGVLWGTSFKNAIASHYNNFSITTNGLYIIDFESLQSWKPGQQDNAHWSFE